MMLLLLRMLSGASPANPYQVCAQATPVLKIEPDNSPELSWVSYAVPGFIQIFIVSGAACGFRPLAKVVSARLRVYSQVARKSCCPKFAVFKMVVNAKMDFLHYFYFYFFYFCFLDMKEVERLVRTIEADGLVWGAAKLVPLAYGIKKLQISCVIEDDKISTDFLEEEITKFEDLVQSMDIAAFNKI